MPIVELVSVGSELVLGQTLDTNAHWLSAQLASVGLPVTLRTTVGDDLPELTEVLRAACGVPPPEHRDRSTGSGAAPTGEPLRGALRQVAGRADVVLITGGLGPTRDDVTRHALAAAAGVTLELDPASRDHIAALFRRWGRQMPAGNEIQAMLPVGGRAIPNPHGTAPGIEMHLGRATVYAMPGVPREMEAMFQADLLPRLKALSAGAAVVERRLHCFGAGESTIGERIYDLMAPDRQPRIGTSVANGLVTVRLVARSDSSAGAQALIRTTEAEVRRRLGQLVFGADDETLEGIVVRLLQERRLTLAVAESCTGGLITHRLTEVPGVSANLLEAVVAYSNRAKAEILGVPAGLFATVGAVSEEVARAMAEGARRRARADLALSATGIAGPTGASVEKPLGLVYVGLADARGTQVERLVLHGDRSTIKDRAAKAALNRLRLYLLDPERRP